MLSLLALTLTAQVPGETRFLNDTHLTVSDDLNFQIMEPSQPLLMSDPMTITLSDSPGKAKSDDNIKVISTVGYIGFVGVMTLSHYSQPELARKEAETAYWCTMAGLTGVYITILISF